MRIRTLSLIAILALTIAACNGGGTENTSTTTAQDVTTTMTPQPEAEAMLLSYSLEPGATYSYEVTIDQAIDLTSSGDTAALGEQEELPGEMSLTVTGTSTFTHTVSDGPAPGTYEINIVGDFSALEFGGTIDGEPVDEAEIPDLAEMEPVDVTIVVDEQGNLIPEDSDLSTDLLGGMGGLDMLDQFGAAAGIGQFVGPPFSEEEVAVGDTWSETIEVPAMPDADPVITQIDSEVVDTDTIDGFDVLVIETTTTTSPIEFDLAQLLIGFMTEFIPEDATEEERAAIDALVEQLSFAFSIDESVAEMTTWFDHEAGLSRQAEVAGDTSMVMDIKIPDETTGELVEFAMDMTIGQNVTYRLVDSSST